MPFGLTLAKLKLFGLAAIGMVVAVLYAMLQVSELKREQFKGKVEKKSAEIKEKATDALIVGLEKETEVANEPVDTTNRDHFG